MSQPITNITIVGGGTAGWMAATFLQTKLNRDQAATPVSVTLIESPNIATIGVGEATVPAMRRWMHELDIDEAEFIRRCNASFKLGVRFSNWNHDSDGRPLAYIHPFHGFDNDLSGVSPAYYFHRFGEIWGPRDPVDSLSPSVALIENLKGPRQVEPGEYASGVRYAYHLDAGLFAQLLQEIAMARGVTHLLDDLQEVELDERGYIAALQLQRNGRFPVELVIDCTGFRGLIIQKTLEEPFQSYSSSLLCDRALAVQVPHQDVRHLEPCTRATALGAGWCWRVPLYSRVGTGYVFSSAFRSDDEATAEFLEHLGPEGQGAEPRAIAMRVGRSQRSWVKNCVAVGLSGGFIEPLESTAIYIISKSLGWLVENFPHHGFETAPAERFNGLVEGLYQEIRNFCVLHYVTTNREDTDFWKAAQHDLEVPESLRASLQQWRQHLPKEEDLEESYLFNYWSYMIILYGKRYFDGTVFAEEEGLAEAEWQHFSSQMTELKARLVDELPDHYELITAIRGAAGKSDDADPLLQDLATRLSTAQATVPLPGQALQPNIRFRPKASTANIL